MLPQHEGMELHKQLITKQGLESLVLSIRVHSDRFNDTAE